MPFRDPITRGLCSFFVLATGAAGQATAPIRWRNRQSLLLHPFGPMTISLSGRAARRRLIVLQAEELSTA